MVMFRTDERCQGVFLIKKTECSDEAYCNLLADHAEEVRAIIQRAAKDVAIESSLKTYEEVWLSKIFELRAHTRMKGPSSATAATQDVNMAFH